MTVIENLKAIMWKVVAWLRIDTWEPQALGVNELWQLFVNRESFELQVSLWLIPWFSIIDKFWKNGSVSTWSAPEDLREYWWIYPWGDNAWQVIYISSSDDLDKQPIELSVTTVDSLWNWNRETFEVNLEWQTKTAITTPSGDPVVRMRRMESKAMEWTWLRDWDIRGTVYVYYDTTVVNWIPTNTDNAFVLSVIVDWSNQTKQLNDTIPSWYVGFLWRWEAWVTNSQWTDECDFAYRSRRLWEVFKEKKDFWVMTTWSCFYQDLRPFPDPIPAKTDISIRVKNVSANNMWAWWTFHILLIEEDRLTDEFLIAIWQIKKITS